MNNNTVLYILCPSPLMIFSIFIEGNKLKFFLKRKKYFLRDKLYNFSKFKTYFEMGHEKIKYDNLNLYRKE